MVWKKKKKEQLTLYFVNVAKLTERLLKVQFGSRIFSQK